MTAKELKNIRKTLYGFNQSYAAHIVGVSTRTWQRYESGKSQIPFCISELFLLKIRGLHEVN